MAVPSRVPEMLTTAPSSDLGVVVINHQPPIRVVFEPIDAAGAPIGGIVEGRAVPRHAVQPQAGAARLVQRNVAIEAFAETSVKGGLKLCCGRAK
jgi:hypothetical protein